jgi:competence protein ComEA
MEPIKNWFGHSRRERRSTFILLILILFVLLIRYAVPDNNMDIKIISTGFADIGSAPGRSVGNTESQSDSLFQFNPNLVSYDTLLKLGFDRKGADMLIRYRDKGGKFRRATDIRKLYGIDSLLAERLIPYILITPDVRERAKPSYSFRETDYHLIDINKCDTAGLLTLPGIGPVLSARILKYRNLLGGFARKEQLKEVYGLNEETYVAICDRIIADSSAIIRIKINTAGYKELSRIPYIERYEVSAIIKYRELMGRLNGIGDLTANKLLSSEQVFKAGPYIDFE